MKAGTKCTGAQAGLIGTGVAMKIERRFTEAGQDAYASLDFIGATSEIRNPDGTIVFRLEGIEVHRPGARWPVTSSRKNTSARPVSHRV